MGEGMGPDFGKTFGSRSGGENSDNTDNKLNLNSVKLPTQSSQIKHIFSRREGHLPDTEKNRNKIEHVANNQKNYCGRDKYGNTWYAEKRENGRQIWVKVHGKTISDAGVNKVPRVWDVETGFNNSPEKNNSWRNKK